MGEEIKEWKPKSFTEKLYSVKINQQGQYGRERVEFIFKSRERALAFADAAFSNGVTDTEVTITIVKKSEGTNDKNWVEECK